MPSLFPTIYKNKSINEKQSSARYKRNLNRQKEKLKKVTVNNSTLNLLDEVTELNSTDLLDSTNLTHVNVACQVGFNYNHNDLFKFECVFNKLNNDVSTQASIPLDYNNTFKKQNTIDVSCGSDISSLHLNTFNGFQSINNESQLKDLTGTTFKVFQLLLSFMGESSCSTISKENRLLIFLIKIKLGITYSAISVLFNVNRTTVTRIFYNTLNSLAIKTKEFIFWPNKKTILETLPKSFKANYPNCRCIIDCTEIKTEQPNTVEQRVNMYSRYKSAYTVKVLVAITPNGLICFVSKCYGGRASDTYITNDSGLLSKLEPGDEVLADKGFPGIKVSCDEKKSILVMPPILHNGRFTEEEVIETYNVASVRIHIERVFARLKTYGILNKITVDLLPSINEIIHICCVLTNLQSPIIKE